VTFSYSGILFQNLSCRAVITRYYPGDIYGLTPEEVQDRKILDTRGCLRFNDLAPFTVFDSFSHPFLPCQCLFTLNNNRVISLVSN